MTTLHMTLTLLLLHIVNIPGRKHHDSDESFENLVVFKDCKYKEKPPETTTTAAPQTRFLRARPNQCRSCCNMCCSMQNNLISRYGDYDDMGDNQNQPLMAERAVPQLKTNANVGFAAPEPAPPPQKPMRPDTSQPPKMKMKKKKKEGRIKPIDGAGRRDLGQARDHIKMLLSRDEEMKRILRDLVRVTIQKVNLLEKMDLDEDEDDDGESDDDD